MSSLLNRLNTALAQVYGNTLLREEDRGYDEYYCPLCECRVYEDEYNHKKQCCYKCWYKEKE